MRTAKIVVPIWRHEPFLRSGPAATGYWLATLAYLQHEMSEDGVLETSVLGMPLGVGRTRALKLCQILVTAGLFTAHARGYELLRYAEKNDTKEDFVRRRATQRQRYIPYQLRADVIKRDGRVCWLCGQPIALDDSLDFDHIVPVSRGGKTQLDNLRPSHGRCNRRRGNRTSP